MSIIYFSLSLALLEIEANSLKRIWKLSLCSGTLNGINNTCSLNVWKNTPLVLSVLSNKPK